MIAACAMPSSFHLLQRHSITRCIGAGGNLGPPDENNDWWFPCSVVHRDDGPIDLFNEPSSNSAIALSPLAAAGISTKRREQLSCYVAFRSVAHRQGAHARNAVGSALTAVKLGNAADAYRSG